MSDAITAALSRIAALEAQVASARTPAEKPANQFNMDAFLQAFVSDPVGTMTRMGAPVDHITKVLVANAMGDSAPPELKMLAAMGPQVSHAKALDSKVEALSRQLSSFTESAKKGTRESFKALANDKTKYPHLAKALAADPELINSDWDAHGGSAEELAAKLEGTHARVAKIYAPPAASDESAETTTDPSTQVKPAAMGGNNTVPPLPVAKPGVFTEDDHVKLRNEIVAKYSSKS